MIAVDKTAQGVEYLNAVNYLMAFKAWETLQLFNAIGDWGFSFAFQGNWNAVIAIRRAASFLSTHILEKMV